jgi:hypothetical protein
MAQHPKRYVIHLFLEGQHLGGGCDKAFGKGLDNKSMQQCCQHDSVHHLLYLLVLGCSQGFEMSYL